jgi:hypothetical protein
MAGEPTMAVWRVYTGDDELTHAEQMEVPLTEARGGGAVSRLLAGPGVMLRRTPPDYFIDWHPAPRRQFVITIAGAGEIELGDGTKLALGPGTITLVEDVDGQGHITRGAGSEDRVSLFIPLDDDEDLS